MAPARILERNVRPLRPLAHDEELGLDQRDDDSNSESNLENLSDDASSGEGADRRSHTQSAGGESDEDPAEDMNKVSFGALKQAQDALSRKRKRGSDGTAEQEEKLAALRTRLKEIRSESKANGPAPKVQNPKTSIMATTSASKQTDGDEDAIEYEPSDSDSGPSEDEAPTKSRTSKHAPASQSSRHQVTRKRTVVDAPKRVSRDPRFDATQQRAAQPGNSGKAYSFLRDYQKAEIAELRAAVKQARNEDDKVTLRRKLNSMENRIKSQEAQERQQEIVKRHRREEKAKVEQGKKPFYLKRKDVKQQALVEKFKGMKGKDREKLIEKRRKKEGQKEKKRMPEAWRVAG